LEKKLPCENHSSKVTIKKHIASTRSGLACGQSQTLVAGVGEAEEDLRILHVAGEIKR
jgi:hypothetical protein